MLDITRASELTPEIDKTIDGLFRYQPWTDEQRAKGDLVRDSLAAAVKTIIANVPPCPDRSVAIRKIIEARMDANAAITLGGLS